MKDFNLKYKPFGERSILIEWPSKIEKSVLNDVLIFKNTLENSNIKGLVEVKCAYSSILMSYHGAIEDVYGEVLMLKGYYEARVAPNKSAFNLWKIPVCYEGKFGLDLQDISLAKNMTETEVVRLHSEAIYTVYFIGFLPGFLYLGGLVETLYFPRKSTPRLRVEKGAVAIGGTQTGVYPNESPGGWNVIGNSPISFFDVTKKEPCFAKPGDEIQFYAVSKSEYDDIKTLVDAGVYQMESEVIHD